MASVWGSLGKVPDGSLQGGRDKGVQDAGGFLGYKADNFLQRRWKRIWES